jgi:hydroxypyruvate isomerase
MIMEQSRRNFLKQSAAAGAALVASSAAWAMTSSAGSTGRLPAAETPFKLKYAPYMDMFPEHAGKDPLDNITFCHDMGFRAMFDNGLLGRPVEEQSRIAAHLQKLNMELGPFVLYADFSVTSFVLNKAEVREMLVNKMKEGVELAKRTGAKWALVVPGRYDERLHRDYQTANVIDNLRYCCDILEPAGLVMVLEPLNTLHDHPGLFLTGIPQSYQICRAVNRPVCKIIDDMYHQQITEGNIIPNIDAAWSEIGAFHIGDNPGRDEPTSGEMNYLNIFKHIHEKGYQGVLCMEHGKSLPGKEGEIRLIKAYRECDNF